MASPAQAARPRRRADFADALIGIACGLTAIFALVFIPVAAIHPPAGRDYLLYWATARQLVHHANPYDPVALAALEHALGQHALGFMRNPPFALPLVWPLGFIGARAGGVLWTVVLIAVLVAAMRALWPVVAMPGAKLAWLGYLSPLAIHVVIAGQTSLFSLLGLALFLRLHRSRPFVAGMALWFCALKPHLLLPWMTALLVWIVFSRAWGVLAGALTALAASCALTAWIDPRAWSQYLAWAHNSGVAEEKLACVSVALRNLIDPRAHWLTFLPAAIGCVWAVAWFWKYRRQWDWAEHGSLVLLVSLAVTPYCWAWDQCLAIPALIFAASRSESRAVLAALAGSYLAIDVLLVCSFGMHSPAWIWLGPFWLFWYVWARRSPARRAGTSLTSASTF
ncbi:MAG TPA: glycosyltransferase 87 family protein [Acidobacteriaceae bacterium]|jgi:hypothetical protein|nr:glycosyltransferase 87 family protein [Acidobacteriaceae bacterium]